MTDGSAAGDSKGGRSAAAGGVASGVRTGDGAATSGDNARGGRTVDGRAGYASAGPVSRGSVVCGRAGHDPLSCQGSLATEAQGKRAAGRGKAR